MLAMRFVQVSVLVVLLMIFCCRHVFSQASSQDSVEPAVANAIKIYAAATGAQAPYYNGVQYRRYPYFIHSGQPFFLADSLIAGTVTYEGITYENVKLQYDEVNDELITSDLQGDNLVQLSKQKINGFSIGPHSFIHLAEGYPRTGFYRVLYNGRSQVLVKEIKSIQVKPGRVTAETERSVQSNTDYYLKTEQGYKKFNRLSSFLSLLGKHRKQVAAFIRENKLRSRTDRENLYYQAVTFYDQLTD